MRGLLTPCILLILHLLVEVSSLLCHLLVESSIRLLHKGIEILYTFSLSLDTTIVYILAAIFWYIVTFILGAFNFVLTKDLSVRLNLFRNSLIHSNTLAFPLVGKGGRAAVDEGTNNGLNLIPLISRFATASPKGKPSVLLYDLIVQIATAGVRTGFAMTPDKSCARMQTAPEGIPRGQNSYSAVFVIAFGTYLQS